MNWESLKTLKGFAIETNPFRVFTLNKPEYPWLSLRSNHGLKLANAFGVIECFQGFHVK
jgi:hypothetical protein